MFDKLNVLPTFSEHARVLLNGVPFGLKPGNIGSKRGNIILTLAMFAAITMFA
jgi:hypothetical protein